MLKRSNLNRGGLAVIAACALSGAAFAQGGTPTIVIKGDLCPATQEALVIWAQDMPLNAAYAAPAAPEGHTLSCDEPGPSVTGGQSWGAETVDLAMQRARVVCEQNMGEEFDRCVVLATVELR